MYLVFEYFFDKYLNVFESTYACLCCYVSH